MNPQHPYSATATQPQPTAQARPLTTARADVPRPIAEAQDRGYGPAPRVSAPPPGVPLQDLTPEGRRERHRRETFERLVRAARTIMFNRGLNDVTVQDITEAADVGKGTFFNYFQSKEHVFTRVAEFNRRGVHRTVERVRAGERSIEDAVTDYFTWIMCPQTGNWLTYETNVLRALSTQPDVRRSFSEQVRASLPLYEEMMKIGQQRGVTREDLTGGDLASMTHLFLAGVQILHWIHGEPPTPDVMADIVKKYFKLLAAPPAVASASAAPATTKGKPVRQREPARARKRTAGVTRASVAAPKSRTRRTSSTKSATAARRKASSTRRRS